MKWVGVVAVAAVLASPAQAKPQDPQIATLKRQVAVLQHQMAALQAQLATEKNWRVCDYALTQDAFRLAVFPALDKFSVYLTGAGVPAWEQIQRFDDAGACQAIGVTRP